MKLTERLMKITERYQKWELPDTCKRHIQDGDYKLLSNRKLNKLLVGENADKLAGMIAEYTLYTYEDVRIDIADMLKVFSGRKVGEFDVERVGMKRIKSLATRIRHRCELLGVSMSDCVGFTAAHISRVAIKETMDKIWRDRAKNLVMTAEER